MRNKLRPISDLHLESFLINQSSICVFLIRDLLANPSLMGPTYKLVGSGQVQVFIIRVVMNLQGVWEIVMECQYEYIL